MKLPENLQVPEGSPEWIEGDSEPAQYYTQNGYEKPWRATREESLELLHGHYATISYTDAQVYKLIEVLKQRGFYENTIIVLTSDHGFSDGEHGYWGKHNMWDHSFQVPLLLKVPEMSVQGEQINALTEHVDIYPTLCDIAELPVPESVEWNSLLPAIMKSGSKCYDAVYLAYKNIQRGIRTDDNWKLIKYNVKGQETTQLFNLNDDPLEMKNLAGDDEYNKNLDKLTGLLQQQAVKYNDVCDLKASGW